MQLMVVTCPCGNPEPHRKLRAKNGRETDGFFSLKQGRAFHANLLRQGTVKQTDKEKTATEQEIAACGLPEESNPPEMPLWLQYLATELKTHPPEIHKGLIDVAVSIGALTPVEGRMLFEAAAETVQPG